MKEVFEKFKEFCKRNNAHIPLPHGIGFFSSRSGKAFELIGREKVFVFNTRSGNNPIDVEFVDIEDNGNLLETNGEKSGTKKDTKVDGRNEKAETKKSKKEHE